MIGLIIGMSCISQSFAQSMQDEVSITKIYKDFENGDSKITPQKLPAWLIVKIEKGNACTVAENQSSKTKLGEPYGLLRPLDYINSEIISARSSNRKIKMPLVF